MRRMQYLMGFVLAAAISAAAAGAQAREFFYMYYKEPVPLTLEDQMIATFEARVPSSFSRKGLEGYPSEPLTDEWSLIDLSGSPVGGDPAAVVALIESTVADPANTVFVAPVFDAGPGVWQIITPTIYVGFLESVPLVEVEAALASVGAGPILESDWLGIPNLFRVEGGSLSGIEVLDRANALAVMDSVRFADVNWLFIGDLTGDGPGGPVAGVAEVPTASTTAMLILALLLAALGLAFLARNKRHSANVSSESWS